MEREAGYQYDILVDPSSQVRILAIEKGLYHAPLRGLLKTQELQTRPQYDAISYCWGAPDTSSEIQLKFGEGYASKRISRVLELTLRRFRSTTEVVYLWNDALCINQDNDEEKGKQVRMMTDIYKSAEKVLIYLGEEDNESPAAFELLDQIYQAMENNPPHDARSASEWIMENGIPGPEVSWAWQPLKNFFRRPWFRRKWIVQECVVAQQPFFFCGRWQTDWSTMFTVVQAFYKYGLGVYNYTTYNDTSSADQLQQGISQFRTIASLKEAWDCNAKYSFLDVAYRLQLSRATDRRDHMYALLGIVNDGEAQQLNPKYGESNTVCKACVQYARHFLHQKDNLEVLYRAGLQGQVLRAPSWVRHGSPFYEQVF